MLIEHDGLRHHWYVVAEAGDLDGADAVRRPVPLGVRLSVIDYVVWRSSDGDWSPPPIAARTARRRCRLGTVTTAASTCPYHGWTFGDGGACVEVPSSGAGRPVPPTSAPADRSRPSSGTASCGCAR